MHLQAQAADKADNLKADIPVDQAILFIVISTLLFFYTSFILCVCMHACMFVCLYREIA